MRRHLSSLALVVGLLTVGLSGQSARIVAIGDIHGDFDAFSRILNTAGLTDASGRWSGGRAVLVQTGDYTDRGENVRAVLDLLMALEADARATGGRAVSLLGNHEVMNLVGETRDANAPIYAKFVDTESESRREGAWTQYRTAIGPSAQARALPTAAVYTQTREAWMAAHPLGYVEYREALGPRGKYGIWLRAKDMVTAIGGSIFMHAGIAPAAAPGKLNDLNTRLRDEVRRVDRFVQRLVEAKLALPFFTLTEILQVAASETRAADAVIEQAKRTGRAADQSKLDARLLAEARAILTIDTWLSLAPDDALWYRGLSTLPDDPGGGPLLPLLAKYDAARFVTGHTPTADRRIASRFGGRAVLIDTGMHAAVYKGRGSALEIDGDRLTAIYEDGRTPLATANTVTR